MPQGTGGRGMSEIIFSKKQFLVMKKWCDEKDTEMPDCEWEMAYFLDGYNYGLKNKDNEIESLNQKIIELEKDCADFVYLGTDQFVTEKIIRLESENKAIDQRIIELEKELENVKRTKRCE